MADGQPSLLLFVTVLILTFGVAAFVISFAVTLNYALLGGAVVVAAADAFLARKVLA